MKLGILFDNRKHLPASVAAAMARRQFETAEHTQGARPREIYFHPDEAPEDQSVSGLTVYTDRTIPLHHIRVTTDEVEEWGVAHA